MALSGFSTATPSTFRTSVLALTFHVEQVKSRDTRILRNFFNKSKNKKSKSNFPFLDSKPGRGRRCPNALPGCFSQTFGGHLAMNFDVFRRFKRILPDGWCSSFQTKFIFEGSKFNRTGNMCLCYTDNDFASLSSPCP